MGQRVQACIGQCHPAHVCHLIVFFHAQFWPVLRSKNGQPVVVCSPGTCCLFERESGAQAILQPSLFARCDTDVGFVFILVVVGLESISPLRMVFLHPTKTAISVRAVSSMSVCHTDRSHPSSLAALR